MKISEKLIQLRTEHDLTQDELGKIAGASNKSVSAWERGDKTPRLKYVQAICTHFGLDMYDFVDEETDLIEEKESSPAPKRSTREWLEDLLIERGIVRRGEALTGNQLEILIALVQLIEAWLRSMGGKHE